MRVPPVPPDVALRGRKPVNKGFQYEAKAKSFQYSGVHSFEISTIFCPLDSHESIDTDRPFNCMFFTPLYGVRNTGCPQISNKKMSPN
jgi:hypothetical protein